MTLNKGFEIYYFDGEGGRSGPLDFEEFMNVLGDLDAEGTATEQDQFDLFDGDGEATEEDAVSDRESTEPTDTATRQETTEGVRE